MPEQWNIRYEPLNLTFKIHPTAFKHTGLFPEQAVNWEWCAGKIRAAGRPVSVLNLFGYTGAATCATASAGASVCHVDAAEGMVRWCRENAALSGLGEAPIRYIVDDCLKFVRREIKRGRRYDAVILDPPTYGRGGGGELWKLEDNLWDLLSECRRALVD
jgi:23S rRNA (cytosine1962-C5)-methyltransferase